MKTMTRTTIDAVAASLPPAVMPAGLRHVDDTRPGFTRKKLRNGFAYFDLDGKRIEDEAEIARINALAIPPAYSDVWICPDARGHIQATGRDARGRKQYRYHPQWRETRDADKFGRMADFGRALPRIRARVARDLARKGMPREKVVAAVVHLLDNTLIRIGSVEYARENQSYGLTTLRKKHVKIRAGEVRFRFAGKSGIEHDVTIDNPRVKRIVRLCAELPGHDLFQYIDADGSRRTVGSADINDYLRDASHADFTAKDYRTWAGSVYALAALRQLVSESAAQAHRHVVATIKDVATLLRNTPAVCKRCYIHPEVIAAFEAGELQALAPKPAKRHMKVDESAFIALLAQLEKRARLASRRARRQGKTVADASEAVDDERLTRLLKNSAALQKGQKGKARKTSPAAGSA